MIILLVFLILFISPVSEAVDLSLEEAVEQAEKNNTNLEIAEDSIQPELEKINEVAAQFESLIYPFVIMFTVPLSAVGAVLALIITGMSLSTYGMIGAIMLVGIVVNNAIVMIDYINNRKEKMNRREAILEAAPKRLRPILMTTLTTVLAMMPLAIGIGTGAETQQPLAVVVIGGIIIFHNLNPNYYSSRL